MTLYESLMEKISGKTVSVGVIGLGYVGLPLAVTFARNGVSVIGFEKSEKWNWTGRWFISRDCDWDWCECPLGVI